MLTLLIGQHLTRLEPCQIFIYIWYIYIWYIYMVYIYIYGIYIWYIYMVYIYMVYIYMVYIYIYIYVWCIYIYICGVYIWYIWHIWYIYGRYGFPSQKHPSMMVLIFPRRFPLRFCSRLPPWRCPCSWPWHAQTQLRPGVHESFARGVCYTYHGSLDSFSMI